MIFMKKSAISNLWVWPTSGRGVDDLFYYYTVEVLGPTILFDHLVLSLTSEIQTGGRGLYRDTDCSESVLSDCLAIVTPVFPSQLVVFITANLECTREDCEALVNLLKTLLKRIDMDREVS